MTSLALSLSILTIPYSSQAQEAPAAMPSPIAYPPTRTVDQVDDFFGTKVADPYRWLENDVRTDKEVADWVTAENRVTNAALQALPGRSIFADRLKVLFDYERFGLPVRKGTHYFYARNSGLQNQAVLFVRDGLKAEGRVLIDPNGWSADGATALAEWAPSEDGAKLLYSVQDGGTDWRTLKVLDVATGKDTTDRIDWVKYGLSASWAKDGSGFYYSRFPAPSSGEKFQALTEDQTVYFHKLGTDQAADTLVYATPDRPKLSHGADVTDDGKWLVITSNEADDNNMVAVLDLTRADAKPRTIIGNLDNQWRPVGNVGSVFYFSTTLDSPRQRIVTIDVAAPDLTPHEIVPQQDAVLQGATMIGGRIIASYLVDVKTEVRRYTLDGTALGTVALPGIGTASGFGGEEDDPETFYAFTSFNYPTTIFRYDIATGKSDVWARPDVAFDPDRFTVEQRFYASKDGTRIPMFVVRRKDVTGPAPTLLYAYGGFNVTVPPGYSSSRIAWLEQGGVYVLANIRGGGEYGEAWHDAGRLANKQNVFDDFIAAGEYLIDQGITGKGQLAIQGGSNGGLLIGAVVNQRPDLFAAALPEVGVMDMLRFDKFTAGRYWVGDYGYPSKEADFKVLRAYSPYHNIHPGKDYPAILVATADTDDRVVPGHSFKYTAALQAADIGDKPHLIRIETRAGHGSGKPTDKIIDEYADFWAFAAKWTGLRVDPVK